MSALDVTALEASAVAEVLGGPPAKWASDIDMAKLRKASDVARSTARQIIEDPAHEEDARRASLLADRIDACIARNA